MDRVVLPNPTILLLTKMQIRGINKAQRPLGGRKDGFCTDDARKHQEDKKSHLLRIGGSSLTSS